MDNILKARNYDELSTYIVELMNDGYEFEEMDGTFADGGAIVLSCKGDKAIVICEDDTKADICYTELHFMMKQASAAVLKAFVRPSQY